MAAVTEEKIIAFIQSAECTVGAGIFQIDHHDFLALVRNAYAHLRRMNPLVCVRAMKIHIIVSTSH